MKFEILPVFKIFLLKAKNRYVKNSLILSVDEIRTIRFFAKSTQNITEKATILGEHT
jgi:hypothetical protein